jgi:cystathionine beta-lyase
MCPVISHRRPERASLSGLAIRKWAAAKRPQVSDTRMKLSNESAQLKSSGIETALVTSGRDTAAQKGFVNPPVVRGSTVLYPTAEDLHAHRGEFQYGRHGTPTTKALQEALQALEGPNCAGVGLAPSGLAAITTALLAVL